jgi:hypothetical protein
MNNIYLNDQYEHIKWIMSIILKNHMFKINWVDFSKMKIKIYLLCKLSKQKKK